MSKSRRPARATTAKAVLAKKITKSYRLYDSATDQVMDLLGLSKLRFWRSIEPRKFCALNGVSFDIRHGESVGLIGRNGSGKTTLLKVIIGATQPSSGSLKIRGEVQALMQMGVGFHPEFTGLENIRATLLHTPLSRDQQGAAEQDIIDFVELGDFLHQPIRTYSQGMNMRLQFACATAVQPDILVIDEILGAGDAYFSAKSAVRMRQLARSGCTLFLVSHAMGQILQFCERALWIEGGKIMADGPAREVVNKYEVFIHELRKKTKITDVDNLKQARNSRWLEQQTMEAMGATEISMRRGGAHSSDTPIYRWEHEDSPLVISDVSVAGVAGKASQIRNGDPFRISIEVEARRTGSYPCIFAILLFSQDGQIVSRHISEEVLYELEAEGSCQAELIYDELLLGPGSYFLSVGVYETLDLDNLSDAKWYDLHARSHEFKVLEGPGDPVALFDHPHRWIVKSDAGKSE